MYEVYRAEPVSRLDVRRLVDYIRMITHTENDIYFDVMSLLEFDMVKLIDGFELEIVESKKMPNLCGETIPSQKKIRLNEEIYVKALEGDGYARFSVAHEIGHLIWHTPESISLCRLKHGEKLITYEDPEWQADAFAGELLMYHPLVKNMSPLEIELKCGVTRKAAITQYSKI